MSEQPPAHPLVPLHQPIADPKGYTCPLEPLDLAILAQNLSNRCLPSARLMGWPETGSLQALETL